MAITKLLRIKESRQGRNPSYGLRRCIEYVCNPEKTENRKLVSGNCGNMPDLIYEQMRANKEYWNKKNGSQGFHYVLSFPPDEVIDEALTMKIAKEFCDELLHSRHLYVIAVHNDTAHSHAHIVFDSVSLTDGYVFHSGQYDWRERIQPIADRLCEKYGLRTLQYDETKERSGVFHTEWEAGKEAGTGIPRKDVSWNDLIRDDLDKALPGCTEWEELLTRLREMHYEVKDGKYLSLRPAGKERFVRTARLGKEYTKENILERIHSGRKPHMEDTLYPTYGRPDFLFRSCRIRFSRPWFRDFSPMEKAFYKKWMAVSHIRKPDFRNSWKYRREAVRLGKMTDEFTYMFDHDITDRMALQNRIVSLTDVITAGERDRRRVINRMKMGGDELPQLQAEKDRLSGQLRELRHELKLCHSIIDDVRNMSILSEEGVYQTELPDRDAFHRITVSSVLFQEVDRKNEFFLIRIPGHPGQCIRLFRDDSIFLNSGTMMSSYIYSDLAYSITDRSGNELKRISGKEVLQYFEDRTQKREPDQPLWKR